MPVQDEEVIVDLPPFGTVTAVVRPVVPPATALDAEPPVPQGTNLLAETAVPEGTLAGLLEPAQPVYARYWLHGKGPAPAGNLPVAVHISPHLSGLSLNGSGADPSSGPDPRLADPGPADPASAGPGQAAAALRVTVACGPEPAAGTLRLLVPAGLSADFGASAPGRPAPPGRPVPRGRPARPGPPARSPTTCPPAATRTGMCSSGRAPAHPPAATSSRRRSPTTWAR